MTPKLAIPLIFALSTSTAALAQAVQTEPGPDVDANGMHFDWDNEIIDAFFDRDTGELLGEDDIEANWISLLPDRQGLVRQHCARLDPAGTWMEDGQPSSGAPPFADGAPGEPGAENGVPADPGAAEAAPGAPGAPEVAPTEPGADIVAPEGPRIDPTGPEMAQLCALIQELEEE